MSSTDRFAGMTPLQRAYMAVEEMRAKLETLEHARTEPIAVVGIGCRFPGGASSPAKFWDLLRNGVDAVTEVPSDRWDIDTYYDPDPSKPGKMCTRWGGFLDDPSGFDASFFGVSRREAELMDPQHRVLLEVAWEALENAGQNIDKLAGSRTGVFIGIYNTDYQQFQNKDEIYAALGNSVGVAAGRLSYTFDLQGPSMLVDTLCSSSLVTVSLACHSLRLKECNMALAGGVNLTLSPLSTILTSRLQALAPDGRCKTFDARANGFVRSEGCGLVVLKRLSDAVADGDPVLALIRGTAVNQDGRSTGLTAPNVLAQKAVIRQAVQDAGVNPAHIGHIEAHGTGTPLGDPIEMEALSSIYGQPRPGGETCFVSSIKTNIGHAEAAAGIAGLIKSILALKHQTIPPHLHLRQLNPRIDLSGTPFQIPLKPQPWLAQPHSRFAAVSAFGLAGTNAHVILEEAPQPAPTSVEPSARPFLLPISARSKEALNHLQEQYAALLADHPALADLCYTASVRRGHHSERIAVTGTSAAELRDSLLAAKGHSIIPGQRPPIAFLFPGHGGQYPAMARALLSQEPVFRSAIEACQKAFVPHVDWLLLPLLEGDSGDWTEQVDRVQPALFAVQVGLTSLWRSWGIVPDAVCGYSMGEFAAAHAAGILSLEDAAQIVCRRGQVLRAVEGSGSLLLTDLSEEEARRSIVAIANLSIAGISGPRTTLIGGANEALTTLAETLATRGVFCRPVQVTFASHTPQMEPLTPQFRQAFAGIRPQSGIPAFYSTVTGSLQPGERCDAAYWVSNIRQTVEFWKALQQMAGDGYSLFVELHPHPVLAHSVAEGLAALGKQGTVLSSLRRGEADQSVLLQSLAKLYEHGQPVRWSALYPNGGRTAALPSYPWQHERFWVEPSADAWRPSGPKPLLGDYKQFSGAPGSHLWDIEVSLESLPYLADHKVEGAVVVPGAFYIATARQAAAAVFPGESLLLQDVTFRQLLSVPPNGSATLQLVLVRTPTGASFQFSSLHKDAWTLHAAGLVALANPGAEPPPLDLLAIRGHCSERVPGPAFYRALSSAGLSYGPTFQGVAELWRGDSEALARIQTPPGLATGELHPALIDACFQLFGAAVPSANEGLYLPVGVSSIRHDGPPAAELWAHARFTSADPVQGDLLLADEAGTVIFHAHSFTVQRLIPIDASDSETSLFYQLVWRHSPLPSAVAAPEPGTWLLLGDDAGALSAPLSQLGESCLTAWPASLTAITHVVFLSTTAASSAEAAAQASTRLLEVIQRLLQTGLRNAPRLFVVTRAAQASGLASPANAALWGLAKTVALEQPEFGCKCIDLAGDGGPAELADLARELRDGGNEDQVALRAGDRLAARLAHWSTVTTRPVIPAGEAAFRLEIDKPGVLDGLTLRETQRVPPGPGEVEIEVLAAGLNFLDVLTAMGLRPGEGPVLLGGECSGIVRRVGENVDEWKPGDAVIAIAPYCFGRFVTTRAIFAAPKPDNLTFEAAAAIPAVFLTAWLALIDAGRLQPGERILIHSGSGGTGLAAIQIAQRCGAEIFATAGNDAKREFLRSIGIQHVMDSRSLAFADEVMRITNGQGVDVVLNALAGDAIEKGISILAPYGRFLEIGKRDIYGDHKLGLLPFRNSLTFSAVDLAGMTIRRPAAVSALLRTLSAEFAAGRLQPLPCTSFPVADAAAAFHTMAQAKHIGKIVLTMDSAPTLPIEALTQTAPIRPDATYLLTGGLGGLGLAVAKWLVEQRARHIVLVSRRSPAAAVQAKLDELRALGAEIIVSATDISNREQTGALLQQIRAQMPPLRGIFHAAAVLEDASLARTTAESVTAVFAPKAAGAWNLHELSLADPLEHFVLFSSAASILGSPGQANYSAANAYLDALALYRRQQSLPALSINWGPWAEIGLAAQQANRGERMAAMGIGSLTPQEGLDALQRLMDADADQVTVMHFNLRHWRQVLPAAAGLPLYSELIAALASDAPSQQESAKFRAELLAAAVPLRRGLLEAHLTEQIAQVLRTGAARVSKDTPFNTMGMDSLMGLELRNRLERSLGASLPATMVWSHPTIAALAPHLAEKMELELEEAKSAPAAEVPEEQDLSDQDAAQLLADKLAALDSEFLS